MGRLIKLHGAEEGECALVISDKHHGKGLGTADILPDNREMQRVCQKLGFRLHYLVEDQLMKADYALPLRA